MTTHDPATLINGVPHYSIHKVENLDEFLVSLASSDDHWMFVSSRGALTAGRRNPDSALFPYDTVDKVFDQRGASGPKISFRLDDSAVAAWEPLADHTLLHWKVTRSLYKDRWSTRLVFEEENLDLGLRFRLSWSFSRQSGFVAKLSLKNQGRATRTLKTVYGFSNLMSSGITRQLQSLFSCLTDSYKQNTLET